MTTSITYIGPRSAVELETAPGRWREVAHGETIDVSAHLAAALAEQADNWVAASEPESQPKPKKTPKKTPKKEEG